MRYCAQPAVQAVTWPAGGALIVMLSALSVSAWRLHGGPGAALLTGSSIGAGASSGAGVSIGAASAASAHPAAANGNAHGAARLDAMLAKLERRLRGGSADPNDWELLAQAYAYLGRADDASNARQRHIVAAAAMLADADNQLPHMLAEVDEARAGNGEGAEGADSGDTAASASSANAVSRSAEPGGNGQR